MLSFIFIFMMSSCFADKTTLQESKRSLSLHDFPVESTQLKASTQSPESRLQTIESDLHAEKATVQYLEAQLLTEKAAVKALEGKLQLLDAKQAESHGSVYVRWGRNSCPNSSEVIYKGYVAGKRFDDQGSVTNTLCLPEQPAWGRYHDGTDQPTSDYRGYIFGAEIDHEDNYNIFPFPVNEQDLPCAVCKTNKSMNLVIPGRNLCYPGWTAEYSGYLVGDSHAGGHGGFDVICLDGEPEFLQHGGTNDNQHVVYLMEGQCGSLPCPPYVQGRELTCVVCSV